LTRFFQILLQTDDDLRRKPDPRVHLEMGLLRLVNASRLAPLEELLAEVRSAVPATGVGGPARSSSAAPVGVAPRREVSSVPIAPVPFPPAPRSFAGTPSSAPVPIRAERITQPTAAPAVVPTIDEPASFSNSVEGSASVSPEHPVAPPSASGLSEEQVAEIKSAIQSQQKMLGEILEHGNRWEVEGAELRIYFSPADRMFAEMLEGRDSLEKMRSVSGKVLGRPVRVCAKLEAVAAAAASASSGGSGTQELRAQFERDPVVKSMLQRFGGKITEVKRNPEES
jgi:DNA polymerase-3 subunit gamma/tau